MDDHQDESNSIRRVQSDRRRASAIRIIHKTPCLDQCGVVADEESSGIVCRIYVVRMHVQCRVSESKDNMGDEQSRADDESCGSGRVDEGESSERFVISTQGR